MTTLDPRRLCDALRAGARGIHPLIVVRVRTPAPPGPVQRKRVDDRPSARIPVKVVNDRCTVSECARTDGAYASPAPAGAAAPASVMRQCGRDCLPATCSHRLKSRASTRVARSQATPESDQRNLNQRSRSSP